MWDFVVKLLVTVCELVLEEPAEHVVREDVPAVVVDEMVVWVAVRVLDELVVWVLDRVFDELAV